MLECGAKNEVFYLAPGQDLIPDLAVLLDHAIPGPTMQPWTFAPLSISAPRSTRRLGDLRAVG